MTLNKTALEIIGAILAMVILVSALGFAGSIEAHYTIKNCEVVEARGGWLTIEDNRGELWSYYEQGRDIEVGDRVNLKVYDNHTKTRTDDEIIKISVRG